MNKVQLHVKYRQIVKKAAKTGTNNTEELKELNEYLDKMYAWKKDVAFRL